MLISTFVNIYFFASNDLLDAIQQNEMKIENSRYAKVNFNPYLDMDTQHYSHFMNKTVVYYYPK